MTKPNSDEPDAAHSRVLVPGSPPLDQALPISSADGPPADEDATADIGVPFPVVGIGASAGGVEAVRQLLQALPVDTGLAGR